MIFTAIAVALAARDVHFAVPASGYTFYAEQGGVASDALTQRTRFLFRGHAVGASKEMEFRADAIKGLFVTPKGAKQSVLKHAETTGPGTVTRTARSGSGTETTVLQGSRFVFDGDASVGHLKIVGPVHINNGGSGKSNLRMTGNAGLAELDMSRQSTKDALRKSTLDGNVVVDAEQYGKNAGTVHATGDHLVLDETVTPHTLTLSGNVAIHGRGKDAQFASGFQKVKFLLNRQGQVTNVIAGEATN